MSCEETYHYAVAQYLMVSVELPVGGFIVEATPEQPYLGLLLKLSSLQLSGIAIQAQPRIVTQESSCGYG